MKGTDLKEMDTGTVWKRGGEAEVVFAVKFNHGGGCRGSLSRALSPFPSRSLSLPPSLSCSLLSLSLSLSPARPRTLAVCAVAITRQPAIRPLHSRPHAMTWHATTNAVVVI